MVEVTDEYRDKCLDGRIPPWDPGAKELMQEMIRGLRRQREEGIPLGRKKTQFC